ncbi:MAG: DUF3592 domain-containing protein [Candidatus Nanopelagicales bacterium]
MTGVASARRRARKRGGKPAPSAATRRQQMLRRFPWPVLVLVPLAGVFLVMAVGLTWQWLSLDSSGLRTSGVVVSVHDVYRGPDTALVEFVDREGSRRQVTVIAGAAPEVGSTVRVVYSPTDPGSARLDDGLDSAVVLAFFWGMGIALLVCVHQYVRRARRRV